VKYPGDIAMLRVRDKPIYNNKNRINKKVRKKRVIIPKIIT